jgi:hypothetical protein
MKKIFVSMTLMFLLTSVSLNAFCDDEQFNLDDANKLLNKALDVTDRFAFETMTAAVQLAADIEPQQDSKKTIATHPQGVYIVCATAKGGAIMSERIGVCRDTEGRVYTLKGRGAGIVAGMAGSVILGYVKTSTGDIRDTYHMGAAGFHAFGFWPSIAKLFGATKSVKALIGTDLLAGRSYKNKTPIIFAGPAFGLMIDLSSNDITIE